MDDSFQENFFDFVPSVCETQCRRRTLSEESVRQTKRLKTNEQNADQNQSIAQSSDEDKQRKAYNSVSDIETDNSLAHNQTPIEESLTISSEEESNETFTSEELTKKLVPTLEALILRGCLENFKSKSTLFKEYSKYCANEYSSVEMLAKNLSAFDLSAEQKLLDLCRKNCPNLKCLRLSYCILSLDLFKSIRSWFRRLQCLHLEYIYGIETVEEWAAVGKIFSQSLINFSFNAGAREVDLTGMLKKLKIFGHLALEEYQNDMSQLFSSVSPHMYKLSLVNYYNVEDKAITALAKRCGPFLKEMEVIYDKYDDRRANSSALFASICRQLTELKTLSFKFISVSDMRPVFKLTKLHELNLQFSNTNFVDFPGVYHLESLRTLSLTKALLTPRRVHSMARAFPYLKELVISGHISKHYLDSAVFCCECKKKDKTIDNCPLCYQNCVIALIEFSILKTLKLNYVRIKSSMSTALPYIPCLKRLVINPFDCDCSRSLLMAAIKIADLRHFQLIIRKCFIREALEEENRLPQSLQIIEYTKYSDK